MTNEEYTQPEPKGKNNGCLIACGCLLGAAIIGIVFIVLLVFIIISGVKSAIKPDMDNFFEKYNNKDMNYICQTLIPSEYSGPQCLATFNKMYEDLGKVINYEPSIFKGSSISVNSSNGKTTKSIKTTGDFEKLKDVSLEFEMYVDKSGNTKINYFEYKKD